jgi:hypothetical protein
MDVGPGEVASVLPLILSLFFRMPGQWSCSVSSGYLKGRTANSLLVMDISLLFFQARLYLIPQYIIEKRESYGIKENRAGRF